MKPLSESIEHLQSDFDGLQNKFVELKSRPDISVIEQKGFERGLEAVALAFEKNAVEGELEPVARRIFDAIRSQGYDIVSKEQQAEAVATGEAETEEGKEEELPEPPYLHIIDHPEEGYAPWTEGKFAKLVEAE